MRMAFYLCDFPPKILKPQSNHKEKIRQIQTEGHSTKYLTITLQNCEGHQYKKSLRNYQNQEELRRHDN
jgi:hypothetical protein